MLLGTHRADAILASGPVRLHQQAGHMTEADQLVRHVKKGLPIGAVHIRRSNQHSENQQWVSRTSSKPSLDSGEGICGWGWDDRRSGDNLRPVAAGLPDGCSLAMSSYSFCA